ncbi:uncharacterized protein LOC126603101 [Malus sylvestris]|uniref:uncharacterized protein LOC126603101 n=1 Tax=Malus sylvestris TaxID=3752 RepID=UPI000498F52F|nr:uncharacterized protein LOC126603101 [Malus sylvestris]
MCIRGWVRTPTSTRDLSEEMSTLGQASKEILLQGNEVGSRMMHREYHVSSPAQVPLAARARHDGKQHNMGYVYNNCGTGEQDKSNRNMDRHKSRKKYKGHVAEQLRGFQLIDTTDDALRRNVANLRRSPFTDEIEQRKPSRKFNLPYFTLFKGDGDPDRHLMQNRRAMTFYANSDAFMCKILAATLQGKTQEWFHTLPPRSIRNFNELSLVFTKEYSSYRSIKKKSDHLYNMKNDPNESLCTYVKRFKAEKAKIVGCDDNIACLSF